MKQEPSDIDELFRQKLHSYESQPLPGSWNRLLNTLEVEEISKTTRKRNYSYYYIGIAASLTAIIITVFYFIYLQPATVSETKTSMSKNSSDARSNADTSTRHKEVHTLIPPQEPKNKQRDADIQTKEKSMSLPSGITTALHEEKTEGEKRVLELSDGSKIHLNRYSTISYSKELNSEKMRIVHLKGEAYFEVKPDPSKPFVVYGDYSVTRVLGTSFMIRSSHAEATEEIYVSSGKVSFASREDSSMVVYLTAGNKGVIGKKRAPVSSVNNDVNYDAWRTEKIVFNNTRLSQVIETLERYSGVTIIIENPDIMNCRFTGTFEKSNIKQILRVLTISFDLSYNQMDSQYILSGKGCK